MDCVELKLKQELNDLCSRLNIDLPFLVSSISIEEFFDNLEKFLGIKQQADAVACWIDEKEHCVYGYYDSDDLFVRQLVYVGIGRSARANSHWAGTHALDFQVFIDELKAFGFQQSDVFEYLVEGLNQRQAAAVETLIIDMKYSQNLISYVIGHRIYPTILPIKRDMPCPRSIRTSSLKIKHA